MKNIINLLAVFIATSGLMAQGLAPALSDATDNGDGTYSTWFGTFTPESGMISNDDWVDHVEHGRIFVHAVGQNLWVWDPNVAALGDGFNGWIYTNRNYHPYFMVRSQPTTWLLYVAGVQGPEGTPRVFVDLNSFTNVYLSKTTTDTIVDIAAGNENFSTLVTAVTAAGLVDALNGAGPLTVFAPTNDAFAAVPADVLDYLLGNTEALTEVLTYHVAAGRLTSGKLGLDIATILSDAYVSGYLPTLSGNELMVETTPFGVMLDQTTMVSAPDIMASNGVIHVIDQVLLPWKDLVDTAVAGGFNTLVAAVQAAGLEETLRSAGPFTVFAPTEEAFAALGAETINALLADPATLADILLYHVVADRVFASEVVPGDVTMANGDAATISVGANGPMIEEANIIDTDIVSSNGVIHVIDAVILPPSE